MKLCLKNIKKFNRHGAAFNPSTREAEEADLSEFQTSQATYRDPLLKSKLKDLKNLNFIHV